MFLSRTYRESGNASMEFQIFFWVSAATRLMCVIIIIIIVISRAINVRPNRICLFYMSSLPNSSKMARSHTTEPQ